MVFEIYATKRFMKEFEKLPSEVQLRIRKKAEILAENPHEGTALTGTLKGKYRLRVGEYRVIYEIEHENNRIFLLAVGHRRNIYR